MLNVLKTFADLDPLLQAVAILALIAFVGIAAIPAWRFIQKCRARRRGDQVWIHYEG